MPKVAASKSPEIAILEIHTGEVHFNIVGTSPLIFNRMAEKAKRELLMPTGRKTEAQRAASLKHDPPQEFRDSVYRAMGKNPPTRLALPAPAFKGAISTAALDLPGTRRTEIGRLTWVGSTQVHLYGVPRLLMSVVRSADIARTPDIRTRAIVPAWACRISLHFVEPKLTAVGMARLIGAAGIIAGVGDFRQEKGKGSYGQFRIAAEDDPEAEAIMAAGGVKAQDAALANIECFDQDSQELFDWWEKEVVARGKKAKAEPEESDGEEE